MEKLRSRLTINDLIIIQTLQGENKSKSYVIFYDNHEKNATINHLIGNSLSL